ncbi:unnamed protein product, partial [Vitis vinifera]
MSFTLDAAQELGIPDLLLWTASACGFMAYVQYRSLIDKGFTPLKDESYLTNGYLDTVVDWIPGMKGIRLKDLPSFIRTTDPDDVMLDFAMGELERARKASAIIFNTFDALEHEVLDAIAPIELQLIESNLWKEEPECLKWLDSKEPNSVVYVNYGSITVMTPQQLIEFAWGLANSNQSFLWILRPDLQVLTHQAIGGFLTHNGWNSIIEGLCAGVPMICWPFFAEQQTNCRYCCTEWGVGMEIDSDVKRDEVAKLVRELMEGEKGKEMKKKTMEWKHTAEAATTGPDGSSYLNLEKMFEHFNHRRLLKARGPNSLDGLPSFQFETIPDGLQPSDVNATQDIPSLCVSTKNNLLPPFRCLLSKLNHNGPPVTCIVSDSSLTSTLDAAQELGIPGLLFWTASACGFMGYAHYRTLVNKGFIPLKDASYLTNGYLDTVIDWIPGMKGIRLKDMPSFVRTTDPDDVMLGFAMGEIERARKASAIIFNTFDALEHEVLDAISTMYPPIYTIGPISLLMNQIQDKDLKSIGSNLWKEDEECLQWLDSKGPNTVVYVNFGSITVMKPEHLIEFAWGLSNSKQKFLWIIRPDLVSGASAILPPEFLTETKDRGLLASWLACYHFLPSSYVVYFLLTFYSSFLIFFIVFNCLNFKFLGETILPNFLTHV